MTFFTVMLISQSGDVSSDDSKVVSSHIIIEADDLFWGILRKLKEEGEFEEDVVDGEVDESILSVVTRSRSVSTCCVCSFAQR